MSPWPVFSHASESNRVRCWMPLPSRWTFEHQSRPIQVVVAGIAEQVIISDTTTENIALAATKEVIIAIFAEQLIETGFAI